ncbi:MAG: endonuclease/exonuclease/phosphatase family protein [Elusimicrobia bacterium]|nr:endonuclease/exonuclease/phosphatase family protein [Elusimicrobiota bacterium]
MSWLALLAAAAFAAPKPVSVVSYNVAGVPVVHPKIDERMDAIGKRLASGGWDVVALQEVWRDSDAEKLIEASGYPYHARAKQRWIFGDGLLILSRFKILETESLSFEHRTTHWFRPDGEQFAHKGALLARLDAPGGELDVVDTHFVADYESYANAETRSKQARQLAIWVGERERGRRWVLAGDLNMAPQDPILAEVLSGLELRDPCAAACEDSSRARRIDYVLAAHPAVSAKDARVLSDDAITIGKQSYRLSDHRAILATVQ